MKKVKILLTVLFFASLFLFIGCIESGNQGPIDTNSPYVSSSDNDYDSLIVKFASTTRSTPIALNTKYGNNMVMKRIGSDSVAIVPIDLTKEDPKIVMDEIASMENVEYVEPNYILKAFATPNDTYYSYQWHMSQLSIPSAWDLTTGSASVKVAVIDTGVAYDLDDLAGTQFDLTNDKDYVNNDNDAYDDNSHGTHCTGTIAQTSNNSKGTVGMAPGVTILPIKVLSAKGSGSTDNIAAAIIYAADSGADIISMSLGGGSYSTTMVNALAYAYNNGVTIFAASGNSGASTVSYPAAYDDYVIAVGATRYDKTRSSYSQYGTSLDIVAPGGDTSVDQNGDGYVDGVLQQTIKGYDETTGTTDYTPGYYFFQGTSMACPHAAGLGALLKSYDPTATPAEIRAAIQNTADDLGTAGRDNYYGYGLINPVAALNYIGGTPSDTQAPVVSTFTGPSSTTVATINITLDGTDNVAITGWLLKETSTTPSASDTGWVSTKPTTYTLSGTGTKTVYAWAKDAAGNISTSKNITVNYTTGGTQHYTDTINNSVTYNTNRTDTYTMNAVAGQIDLTCTFSTSYSTDIDIFLYDPNGTLVASSEGTTGTETISYAATTAGTYTVKVYLYSVSSTYRKKARNYTLQRSWYGN